MDLAEPNREAAGPSLGDGAFAGCMPADVESDLWMRSGMCQSGDEDSFLASLESGGTLLNTGGGWSVSTLPGEEGLRWNGVKTEQVFEEWASGGAVRHQPSGSELVMKSSPLLPKTTISAATTVGGKLLTRSDTDEAWKDFVGLPASASIEGQGLKWLLPAGRSTTFTASHSASSSTKDNIAAFSQQYESWRPAYPAATQLATAASGKFLPRPATSATVPSPTRPTTAIRTAAAAAAVPAATPPPPLAAATPTPPVTPSPLPVNAAVTARTRTSTAAAAAAAINNIIKREAAEAAEERDEDEDGDDDDHYRDAGKVDDDDEDSTADGSSSNSRLRPRRCTAQKKNVRTIAAVSHDDDDDDDPDADDEPVGLELTDKRRRNREHAKRSRLRKRVRLGGLEDMVLGLRRENVRLRQMVMRGIPERADAIIRKCAKDNTNADVVAKQDVVQGMRPGMSVGHSSSSWSARGGSRRRSKRSRGNVGVSGGSSSSSSKDHRVPSALKLMSPCFQTVTALSESQANFILTNPNLPDCPIIFASQGFLELTGYEAREVIGRNCRFLQGPGTDPATVAILRDNLAAGRDASVCILNYKKDRTPFWNQLSIGVLLDAHGQVANHVGVVYEVNQMPPSVFHRLLHRVPLPESLLQDDDTGSESNGEDDHIERSQVSSGTFGQVRGTKSSGGGGRSAASTSFAGEGSGSGSVTAPRVVDRLQRTRAAAAAIIKNSSDPSS